MALITRNTVALLLSYATHAHLSFSEDDCTTPLGEIAVVHTTVDLSLLNSCVHDLRICSKLLCTIVTSTLGMYETDRLRTPIEPRVLK